MMGRQEGLSLALFFAEGRLIQLELMIQLGAVSTKSVEVSAQEMLLI